MEVAFLSGLTSASLEVLVDKISTFAIEGIGRILGVDLELQKLERTLSKIQALVDEIESKQMNHKPCRVWLQDLKIVFYEAEDLLDEVFLKFMRLNPDKSIIRTNKKQVRHMVLKSFKFNLPNHINEIQKKLEDMVNEMDSQFMTEIMKLRQPLMMRRPHSSSFIDIWSVVGREEDKLKIIQQLLIDDKEKNNLDDLFLTCDKEKDNLDVLPIVGMCGIGKTTLAQITKSIVESVTGETLSLSDLDPLQVKLQQLLEGKIFLLVLDDIWNENPSDWDVLCMPFRVGAKGSKILVTTRSTVVSSIVSRTSAYYLQPLSNEDCWALIKQRALSSENMDGHENLAVIGNKIAEKCKGIPLAAKTLGNVLQLKPEEKQWEALLKSELWDLPQARNDIFPALKLSFDHLPAPLKRCFAYCSIFPVDYEFEKENLVQLWMVEGFLHPEGARRPEDIGRDYFEDLLSRSFFQFSHHVGNEQPIYKMNGLIRNLAQVVSADICFRTEDEMSYLPPTFRHARRLSVLCQGIKSETLEVFQKYNSLRTLMLCNNGSPSIQLSKNFFEHLHRLRVFDASCTAISVLPESIGKLKHLRYLNLSKTDIQKLPESTANLYGLQTIKLKDCTKFCELPKEMKNLNKLEHLDLDIKTQLRSMPPEFGRLTSLQTLHAFIVGKDDGFRIEELKNIRDLRGSICITALDNVSNKNEAENAMLNNKPYLEKLELRWKDSTNGNVQQEVLAGLRPHNRLRELKVKGYGGLMFPNWLSDDSLCNLGVVCLRDCQHCRVIPSLGRFPALKTLKICNMNDLEELDHQFCGSKGFLSLKSLEVSDMLKLQKWEGLYSTHMIHLHQLTLEKCPSLGNLPSLHYLTSLEKLHISSCPQLKSLPERGLPISLKQLIIAKSDILKERCKMEEGEDWSKIKTVPTIWIDDMDIPLEGRGN